MDTVVLQRADHFKTCTVSHVRQTRIAMAAEVALENLAVAGSIEDGSPCLELTHACRSFPGVKFRHLPAVHVLTAAHGVGEVDFPVVSRIHRAQGSGNTAFSHYRVRFPKKRFAYETDTNA